MKLNCKPGDLAILVHTHDDSPETAQFLGRIVRVRSYSAGPGGAGWSFENEPLRGKWRGMPLEWYTLPDEWLRPLRDDSEDKTETQSKEKEAA